MKPLEPELRKLYQYKDYRNVLQDLPSGVMTDATYQHIEVTDIVLGLANTVTVLLRHGDFIERCV